MAEGHLSEAACLIEQGATYRRRLGLQPVDSSGEPIFAGFKPGAFAIYFGDAPYYHFDLEGRWQLARLSTAPISSRPSMEQSSLSTGCARARTSSSNGAI